GGCADRSQKEGQLAPIRGAMPGTRDEKLVVRRVAPATKSTRHSTRKGLFELTLEPLARPARVGPVRFDGFSRFAGRDTPTDELQLALLAHVPVGPFPRITDMSVELHASYHPKHGADRVLTDVSLQVDVGLGRARARRPYRRSFGLGARRGRRTRWMRLTLVRLRRGCYP